MALPKTQINPKPSYSVPVIPRRYSNLTTVDVAGRQTLLSEHIKLFDVILDKNVAMDIG